MQNRDGGFASYELVRGPSWVELLNPAEVFGESVPVHRYSVIAEPRVRENHDRIRISGVHNFSDHLAFYLPKALP
jgi:lanosterol synthase